jgi:hypothetical protein
MREVRAPVQSGDQGEDELLDVFLAIVVPNAYKKLSQNDDVKCELVFLLLPGFEDGVLVEVVRDKALDTFDLLLVFHRRTRGAGEQIFLGLVPGTRVARELHRLTWSFINMEPQQESAKHRLHPVRQLVPLMFLESTD